MMPSLAIQVGADDLNDIEVEVIYPDELFPSAAVAAVAGPVQVTFESVLALSHLIDALTAARDLLEAERGREREMVAQSRARRQAAEWARLVRHFGPAWEAKVREDAARGMLADGFLFQVGDPDTWPHAQP